MRKHMRKHGVTGISILVVVAGPLLGQLNQTGGASGGGGGGGPVTQSGIWNMRTQDGAGNPLASSTTAPVGTEQALITRTIPSGTQAVSGTVGATQSGTWTVQPGNTANTTPWLSTINQGGNSATVSVAGALKVDGSAVTQPVNGTVTANAGTGNFTVVQSTAGNLNATVTQAGTWTVQPGNTANTTPWLSTINQGGNSATVSVAGALKVDGSAVTQPVSGTVTATQATASNLNAQVQGAAATDAAVAGNPVLAGCRAEDSVDAAPGVRVSAEGDAVPCSATRDGAVRVVFGGAQSWSYHENSSAALTDTTVHAAAGAGLFNYICTVVFSTGAATAFNLFIEDGTTTTILGPYYLEAVNGRGAMLNFSPCKKQTTANTAITVTTSAAIAHSIDITGYVAE